MAYCYERAGFVGAGCCGSILLSAAGTEAKETSNKTEAANLIKEVLATAHLEKLDKTLYDNAKKFQNDQVSIAALINTGSSVTSPNVNAAMTRESGIVVWALCTIATLIILTISGCLL